VPARLGKVTVRVASASARLNVVSSDRPAGTDELVSLATAAVPAALIGAFASAGSHSMVIETETGDVTTVIRFGNTGAQQNLPRLAAGCGKPAADRAGLPVKKATAMAVQE
jgi:hypothetical protein